jgi:hypothetical protein
MVNPEVTPTPFMMRNAWKEIALLSMLGGKDLVNLSTGLWTGFARFPGKEDELAEYLEHLPMRRIPLAPIFYYHHKGVETPLLVGDKPHTPGTMTPTMHVLDHQRYVEVAFRDTPQIRLLLRGADNFHRAIEKGHHGELHIGKRPRREELYIHIVRISEMTAKRKGLLW